MIDFTVTLSLSNFRFVGFKHSNPLLLENYVRIVTLYLIYMTIYTILTPFPLLGRLNLKDINLLRLYQEDV